MARAVNYESESVALESSSVKTETGNGEQVNLPVAAAFAFVLDVTEAATEAGDTLDVYVQTLIGGNWVDVVHFTQVLGTGGTQRCVSKIAAGLANSEFDNGTSLGAAAVRNLLGDAYRVRWAITDASTDNASFTFSVTAIPF